MPATTSSSPTGRSGSTRSKKPAKKPVKKVEIKPKGRMLSQKANRQRVAELYGRLNGAMPDAHCELTYNTPYQLLVSVVLSAQATDKMVNKVMEPLYAAGFTPQTVIGWGQEGLLARINKIGLAPTKAKNVHKLSQILIADYDSAIPTTREGLEALPGVGRKTANVILGEIFGQPTLAVDTHVFRVGYRLGLHREDSPAKAELALLKVIDDAYLPKLHHLFIFQGRYTCKAQKPLCGDCTVADLCPSLPSATAS